MKKINIDDKELIIADNKLSISRTRLIQLNEKDWEIERYSETLCHNINLDCEKCIFFKDKCNYQKWMPGLKEGKEC
jgi:hypothetical protein